MASGKRRQRVSLKTLRRRDESRCVSVLLAVGNKKEQTSARMRTTDPVYEQALTFLVCNPESDDLHLKVLDQKTGHELGYRKITLVSLLTLPGLTLPPQPLGLKNSGPDSKLIVSVHLKVSLGRATVHFRHITFVVCITVE